MQSFSPDAVQSAILKALPEEFSEYGHRPEAQNVYFAPAHVKALRLESSVVIGARGVGKSFWSAALTSPVVQELLQRWIREFPALVTRQGYGDQSLPEQYPDAEVFGKLISEGFEPYHIWRTVLSRWYASMLGSDISKVPWKESVLHTQNNPENFARLQNQADKTMADKNQHGLVIFDALDKSSHDWKTMDFIVRDLLRVLLLLKPFKNLHGKVFLREDQYEGRNVKDFPDASKLDSNKVELEWDVQDLNGLLWQYLLNAGGNCGPLLRDLYWSTLGENPDLLPSEIWTFPDSMKRNQSKQRLLFSALAGPWMGRDARRGDPYTWTVSHLADGKGRTSPRSFLKAIRVAAEDTQQRHPEHDRPLHFESVKIGVQEASKDRVAELAEDYPWVQEVLGPLRGLNVPCTFDAIKEKWVIKFGFLMPQFSNNRLQPESALEGWDGINKDLKGLGIFSSLRDGRINMPDLYRIGSGLGRKGGVAPSQRISSDI